MLTPTRTQRGNTLVQLMVGILVGFFVLMAVTQFFVRQLTSSTDLLRATRLNQELRTIMDLIVHDIRRGAYWENAITGVWYDGSPGITANPLQSITVGTTSDPTAATADPGETSLTYSYDVNGDGALTAATDTFTIQLNNNAVELVQNGTALQLSDTTSTTITNLRFKLWNNVAPAAVTVTCALPGSNPTLTVREIYITLTGRLVSDPTVTRTLQESVRIRSDKLIGSCPTVIS